MITIDDADIEIIYQVDDDPDLSWLDQTDEEMGEGFEESARKRLATYGHDWYMIGIWAEATIGSGGPFQTIRSGGLWGVESDSDVQYITDIERDERDELISILRAINIDVREEER